MDELRFLAMLLAALLPGCAGAEASPCAPPSSARPPAPLQSASAAPPKRDAGTKQSQAGGAGTSNGNPCAAAAPRPGDFRPEPRPRAPNPAACAPRRAAERVVRAELEKRMRPLSDAGRLEVSFRCDAMMSPVHAIVYEYGNDTGITRWMVRRQSKKTFLVTSFRWPRRPPRVAGVTQLHREIERGSAPAGEVEGVIARVRAAIRAQVRELWPQGRTPRAGGFGRMSDPEYYFVQLIDTKWRSARRTFRGLHETTNQADRVPLELIHDALEPLRKRATAPGAEFTDEERRFLARWLYESRRSINDPGPRWNALRVADVARHVPSRDLMPTLLEAVRFAPDRPWQADALDRMLGVLTEVTGWDARMRRDGTRRTRTEAARAYVKACGKLWGLATGVQSLPPGGG